MRLLCMSVFLLIFLLSCNSQPVVSVGLDNISDYSSVFAGKRLGIITNHTAYNSNGQHITDVFLAVNGVTISALFGPEHGIRGDEAAGAKIGDAVDPLKNIPIYSLYGKTRKPTAEMLANVDVLVFDIQDVGARFYTYISTMSLAMEAAAEQGIPFVVLDRPNPINGVSVEGNLLEPEHATFVGLHPIPVRHGMTAGEMAKMFNEEGWLKDAVHANLTIIPMKNWQRKMWYDQTGLTWRPPSPNIPDLQVAAVYPGTCLFEGTNLSEGRGTYQPFLRIGAPWLNPDQLADINKVLDLDGVLFETISFTPKSIPNMAPRPKFMDNDITGLSLTVTDRDAFLPYLTGIALVKYLYDTDKENFEWRERHFDRLCGSSKIREMITDGKDLEMIRKWLEDQKSGFSEIRAKYLLYQ
ncbi:MAG: DUF1343 domain-containing protein [Calditrichales bacterium]|nr:MAG: DUF1343 domain-containing protein [Calditrichales bacterium]